MATGVASLGGAAMAGAAYALEQIEALTPNQKSIALIAGGIVAGAAASGWHAALGAGIAAGAVGIGGKTLLDEFMIARDNVAPTEELGAMHRARRQQAARATHRRTAAPVEAQLNAVGYDLDAVGYDLDSMIEATLV